MKDLYFKVAGHVFVLQTGTHDSLVEGLSQYAPFATGACPNPVFCLRIVDNTPNMDEYVQEMHQEDEGQSINAGHIGNDPCFEFWLGQKRASVLVTNSDYTMGSISLENNWQFGLNNAIMVMYALATACCKTALFHSSVVSYRGRAFMFLGSSGTGKSTHSQLWLKYIEGTELVNDDNPVVRIMDDGNAVVYGSPWSGKTPCYRNVSYPLQALVKLNQAPYNEIKRLKGLRAYAELVPSISGKRWDAAVADGLHETESLLAQHVAVWHLDCLPDEAAAQLCKTTCAND